VLLPEADYAVWLHYLQSTGDEATLTRLQALYAAQHADCETVKVLADGTETHSPLMILAEACVAARRGATEVGWLEEWTHRLVRLAVTWQDELTMRGVADALNHTRQVMADMKRVGLWPWPDE
jgi:hypothetical protein